jgi:hypothetical protein
MDGANNPSSSIFRCARKRRRSCCGCCMLNRFGWRCGCAPFVESQKTSGRPCDKVVIGLPNISSEFVQTCPARKGKSGIIDALLGFWIWACKVDLGLWESGDVYCVETLNHHIIKYYTPNQGRLGESPKCLGYKSLVLWSWALYLGRT